MLSLDSIKIYGQNGRRISEIESIELSGFTPVKENVFENSVSNTVAGNPKVASCKVKGVNGYVYVAFAPSCEVSVGQTLPDKTYAVSIWQHANDKPKLVIEKID